MAMWLKNGKVDLKVPKEVWRTTPVSVRTSPDGMVEMTTPSSTNTIMTVYGWNGIDKKPINTVGGVDERVDESQQQNRHSYAERPVQHFLLAMVD